MKEKATPDGVVDKVKARVVAGGIQQDKSIYTLDETSSPTVSTAAVLVTMAIAAHEGRHVMTMDVETAYLNAKMIDDKNWSSRKGAVTVKLDKALYGCVESAVLWYKNLRSTLEFD